jgi:hypothetical protein
MASEGNIQHQLDDLLFELTEGGRAKFLFALCDGAPLRNKLQRQIESYIRRSGRGVGTIVVSRRVKSLFRNAVEFSRDRSITVVNFVGFEKLSVARRHAALGELNFHRDALSTLGVTILFWFPTKMLATVIAHSPDLWSRRGAVYYFSQTSTKTLLNRLFEKSSTDSSKWVPEPILSEAFQKIFAAERSLAQCLRDKKSFSLPKADALLSKIHAGIDALETECKRGRQIEVALWLWNLSHLDAELQAMLDSLETPQQARYESLYTDRNEALLFVAKKLPEILTKYRQSLNSNTWSKTKQNLLKRAKEVAFSKLSRMARELSSPVQMPLALDPDLDSQVGSLRSWITAPDSIFVAKAATEMEQWLVGINKAKPVFFSDREAELLKLLYLHDGKTKLVARLSEMTEAALIRTVNHLKRKVSLYLGTSD